MSIAVQLLPDIGDSFSGIISVDLQVGKDCRIYIGGDKTFVLYKVKGWIGPHNGVYKVVFDGHGKRYRMELIAKSSDFV